MIETLNVRGNFFKAILDGKMTGVEPVHLCIRQIGFPSIACEKNVVLSPKNNCLRLQGVASLLECDSASDV